MQGAYGFIQGLALVVAIIFTVFWAKNYKISKWKAFPICVTSQFLGFLFVFLLTWIENGFTKFGAQNAVRFYPFLLLIGILEAKVFREKILTIIEFQAVTIPLTYGLGHLACLVPKCCGGFHYLEGSAGFVVANALTGTDQLPLQLFESISALLIFVIIVIMAIKSKFKVKGYLFALYHVLFGATRFLWEFLRDNDKIIKFGPINGATSSFESNGIAMWGISNLAIWSLAILAVGIGLFIGLKIYHNKQEKKINNSVAS